MSPEGNTEPAAPRSAPRFSLYEEAGAYGVLDQHGPQLFFAETRERALAEVQRANEIVAQYPSTISMRHLREMDSAWRAERGLPPLPEPTGRRLVIEAPRAHSGSVGIDATSDAGPTPEVVGTKSHEADRVGEALAAAAGVRARYTMREDVVDVREAAAGTRRVLSRVERAAVAARDPMEGFRQVLGAAYADEAHAAEATFVGLVRERGAERAAAAIAGDPRVLAPETRGSRALAALSLRDRLVSEAKGVGPLVALLEQAADAALVRLRDFGAAHPSESRLAADEAAPRLRALLARQESAAAAALSHYQELQGSLATRADLRRKWTVLTPAERRAVRTPFPDIKTLLNRRTRRRDGRDGPGR